MHHKPLDPIAALHAYLEQHRHTAFAMGVHDCCLFAAGGVQAMTGRDLAAELNLRGRYTNARGAANVLRRFAGKVVNIPEAAGLKPVPVKAASRGSVVASPIGREGRTILGLCDGPRSAFPGPAGFIWIPTLDCSHAWKI